MRRQDVECPPFLFFVRLCPRFECRKFLIVRGVRVVRAVLKDPQAARQRESNPKGAASVVRSLPAEKFFRYPENQTARDSAALAAANPDKPGRPVVAQPDPRS